MFDALITAYKKDPALRKGVGFLEVLLYQGVHAIWLHRIAHFFYKSLGRIPTNLFVG